MLNTLPKEIEFEQTAEMKLADKLLNRETVTKGDIQALNMFGDKYIDMLLKTPQSHVRTKLAEILVNVMK